jgi:hypothetical protein
MRPGSWLAPLLLALTACGPGDEVLRTSLDLDHPYSLRLGQFRYLESVLPFIDWLDDQGLPAYPVGHRTFDEGTWYEVHVGAAATEEELAPVVERLADLGFRDPQLRDLQRYADHAFFDVSDYQLWSYDPARTRDQVGDSLHELAASFPCHPRFGLASFTAGYALDVDSELIQDNLGAHELHDVIRELASESSDGLAVSGHAVFGDLVTGATLQVSSVSRSPLPEAVDLGRAEEKFEGPAGSWFARPVVEPGATFDGPEVIYLLWSEDRTQITLVTADDPVGYELVPELFDRRFCEGGAFQFASLWRPLGILPTRFEPDDVPVAVDTSILGDDYVASKGNAAWARKMKGRWTYSTTYAHDAEDYWAVSVFDLETARAAEECHGKLYTREMWRAYRSWGNELARAWGMDAVYTTRIRGVRAWYVDHYQSQAHKELNFYAGPFVFALGSFVTDPDPLRMDDLVDRAKSLPLLGGDERW